ncbi:MAG: glycosyltransferase family 4 protein [Schleiferiaceae bacterium]|jgi:glycosyltransferase involved in cell wall biosynthesis|nr:glycosyltransferase family 4 protein [Schleiferiaceae bacterium]
MESKLRIAQIVPSLLPKGPVNVSLDLTHLLREQGHFVELFFFDDLEGAVEVNATRIGWRSKIDWSRFNIVHSHGLRPDLYVRSNYKKMPASVTTIHNYAKTDLKHTYNSVVASSFTPVWRWARSKHNAKVVLSQDMMNYYNKTNKKDYVIIPNTRLIGVEPNSERNAEIENIRKDFKVIGSLSTVTSIKGLDQILDFISSTQDWIYVHVGGGELEPLIAKAKELGVEDRCFFLGHKENGFEYVHSFDVFAIPSISEGFPLSLIEAVQLQVPVVASDIAVFKEIFTEQEVSFFKLQDTPSLTIAVQDAFLNKDNFAKNAKVRFDSSYSPQVVIQKYIDCYQSVIHA